MRDEEARFTIQACDVGFLVTEEHWGLDRFGEGGFIVDREIACRDAQEVEDVLLRWEWPRVLKVGKVGDE